MLGANAKKSANVNEYFDYQKERKLPQTSNLRDFPEYEADDIKLSNNLSLASHVSATKLKTDCKYISSINF